MDKQTNGTDENSVIIVDQYLFYLLRNDPLLTYGVALIYIFLLLPVAHINFKDSSCGNF